LRLKLANVAAGWVVFARKLVELANDVEPVQDGREAKPTQRAKTRAEKVWLGPSVRLQDFVWCASRNTRRPAANTVYPTVGGSSCRCAF
jgi:hypothetical protein